MEPREFITSYESALATQKWENVDTLIHQNACVSFSNGAFHRGKAAVRKAFEFNFSLIKNESYNMSDVHWVYEGEETAVYHFRYQWSGWINGQKAGGAGIGTTTLVKEGGKWLLIAEHLGPAAPQ